MGTKSPTTLFQLKDVSLICGATRFDILQTPFTTLKLPIMAIWSSPYRRTLCRGRWWETVPLATTFCTQRSRLFTTSFTKGNRVPPTIRTLIFLERGYMGQYHSDRHHQNYERRCLLSWPQLGLHAQRFVCVISPRNRIHGPPLLWCRDKHNHVSGSVALI